MSDRPYIFLNMAMTADGKITSAAREYPRITTPFDRRHMDRLRAEADAVLIGAGTLRADDPPLGVRDPDMQAFRATLGKTAPLISVVLSRDLDLDPNARFFSQAPGPCIVATVASFPPQSKPTIASEAEIWQLGSESVDLQALVQRLRRQRDVARLLVEGGAELNAGFLAANLIDELNLTIAPTLLGGRSAPTIIAGEGLAMAEQQRLVLRGLHREGDELYLRYLVER